MDMISLPAVSSCPLLRMVCAVSEVKIFCVRDAGFRSLMRLSSFNIDVREA